MSMILGDFATLPWHTFFNGFTEVHMVRVGNVTVRAEPRGQGYRLLLTHSGGEGVRVLEKAGLKEAEEEARRLILSAFSGEPGLGFTELAAR